MQERPVRADALLGSADKVSGLAALSDSADYLADVIARSGAMDVSTIGGGSRPSSPMKGQSTNRVSGMLTLGMSHLMDRCVHGCPALCTDLATSEVLGLLKISSHTCLCPIPAYHKCSLSIMKPMKTVGYARCSMCFACYP